MPDSVKGGDPDGSDEQAEMALVVLACRLSSTSVFFSFSFLFSSPPSQTTSSFVDRLQGVNSIIHQQHVVFMAANQSESSLSLTAAGKKVIANADPISATSTNAVLDGVHFVETFNPPTASKWGQYLAVLSFANLAFFNMGLWLNIVAAQAQGQGLRVLAVPFIFALSQIFEHSKQPTTDLYHADQLYRLCNH